MNRPTRIAAALYAAILLNLAALAGDAAPVMAILHTNDIHGRLQASDESVGHDRIATLFRQTRRRIPATLLLDAGDAVQDAPIVKWNRGRAAIDIMNRAGYDGMTPGNHEFDYGWERLLELAALAEFPFLTQSFVVAGEKGLETAALYERGGRRFGVFGLTTPETKRSSGGGLGREFGGTDDLVAYAEAMALSLRRAGAEVVVCLSHLGVDDEGFLTSLELRDRVRGLDVIVDGHSHTPLADIVQADGRALVVSAGEYGNFVGLVEFYCEDGRLRPHARSIAAGELAGLEPDEGVAGAIREWADETEARGSRLIARSPVLLDADRDLVRRREAEIGNALADAMRLAAGAEAAFMNGGSIRATLPAGDLTVNQVETTLPYDTLVLTAGVRGGAIREALELSVSRYPENNAGFLQVSGLAFAFDPAKPRGERVTRVEIGGAPLDDDRVYRVANTDWLASGGDGYEMFVAPYRNPEPKTPALIDVFVDYLNGGGEWESKVGGRIVAE